MKVLAPALVALFFASPLVPVVRAQHPPAPSGTIAVYCQPGVSGVILCPCSNPPGGSGGCDNSSATGGAVLSGSGVCIFPTDTLVLTTSGEKPTALSVLAEGLTSVSGGLTFGMGVRCYGTLKRLYMKSAVGGSITVPTPPDPPISVRSFQRGDTTLAPGAVRYYFVYYRDPTVLGACPATSTFNASQGLEVTW
jgi:hypothetical protein